MPRNDNGYLQSGVYMWITEELQQYDTGCIKKQLHEDAITVVQLHFPQSMQIFNLGDGELYLRKFCMNMNDDVACVLVSFSKRDTLFILCFFNI